MKWSDDVRAEYATGKIGFSVAYFHFLAMLQTRY